SPTSKGSMPRKTLPPPVLFSFNRGEWLGTRTKSDKPDTLLTYFRWQGRGYALTLPVSVEDLPTRTNELLSSARNCVIWVSSRLEGRRKTRGRGKQSTFPLSSGSSGNRGPSASPRRTRTSSPATKKR